ncbi:MAG: hypothetical protein R3234_10930, partial [Thermoanaerobaculia bacterium]|nr:hypothetical protein [Thermoanaerobaculia bacterium]
MTRLLRLWPWLFAVAGGWLWATQFEARPDRWAPWVALTPLILLSTCRHPLRTGWLWGVSFWLFSIPWLVPTLVDYGRIPFLLGCLLLLLLAAYLGLFAGLFTGWGARLWAGPWPLVLVALPAVWVLLEWVRGWLFGGFPWNR